MPSPPATELLNRTRISPEKPLGLIEKLARLRNHFVDFFLADNSVKTVVGLKPSIKSIQQEAVKFRIDQSRLGELLPEERVYTTVLAR